MIRKHPAKCCLTCGQRLYQVSTSKPMPLFCMTCNTWDTPAILHANQKQQVFKNAERRLFK